MKRLILTLVVALVAAHASAQVITTLKSYRFDNLPVFPPEQLVRDTDGTLYGINHSTIFKLQPDGSGFSVLKQSGLSGYGYFAGRPAISGNTIYGTSSSGIGVNGSVVTVFRINTDGTGLTVLKTNLLFPATVTEPGIVLSDETLYGWGFKVNTDGSGYAELASFPSGGLQSWPLEVQVSGNHIFGASVGDGQYASGTVFRLNTDGTGYTVLTDLPPGEASLANAYLTLVGDTLFGTHFVDTTKLFKVNTNGTGYNIFMEFPYGTPGELQYLNPGHLRHSGGRFYAVGGIGGTNAGPPTVTVFSMGMDGTGYTVLKRFVQGNNPNPANQGYFHVNLLTVEGDIIYGMAQSPTGFQGTEGGLDGRGGALFKMNTDGLGFAVLKEFAVPNPYPDGRSPGPLTVSDGTLYGFDYAGDASRRLFKMSTAGTGFAVLKGYEPNDRFEPVVRPTVSGSTLFGVGGGRGILQPDPYDTSNARVYRMNNDGTGYTVLKEFTLLTDGARSPAAALALSGDTLFGTIGSGRGGSDGGKIFTLNTNGAAYTFLRTLGPSTLDTSSAGYWTNSEGVLWGGAELTISNNTLYGAASEGGLFGCGTVFKMNTDSTGFTVLKHLTPQEGSYAGPLLTLSGNTLYGASFGSSDWAGGTVWRVNTDGTGFMVVKQFPNAVWDNASGCYTNSEGVNPMLGLALWGNTLYGTTTRGGRFGAGTLFKLNTDGTGFAVLEHLERGGQPWDGGGLRGLVVSGSALYGSAPSGGDQRVGGIYSIDLTPTLSIEHTGANTLAVTWPSVWTDYVLQQNTNGISTVNWSNVTSTIQDNGTTKTLIVNPTGVNRFYRLVGN